MEDKDEDTEEDEDDDEEVESYKPPKHWHFTVVQGLFSDIQEHPYNQKLAPCMYIQGIQVDDTILFKLI